MFAIARPKAIMLATIPSIFSLDFFLLGFVLPSILHLAKVPPIRVLRNSQLDTVALWTLALSAVFSLAIFTLYLTENLTLSFGFSNGLLLNILRNRNESNEVINYDPDTGIGYATQVPRKLKTDSYYTLTPYADVSYRLIALDIEETAFMFLTAKAGYRNVLGNVSFSKPSDFRNYIVSLGITFKGILD